MKVSPFLLLPALCVASLDSAAHYRSGVYAKPYLESMRRGLMGTADTCPAGSFDIDSSDGSEVVDGNKYSQGSNFVNTLKDFRGGSNNYYERTLRMMMTYFCVNKASKPQEELQKRCGDTLEVGNIALNATTCNPWGHCGVRQCEVPSNCYWQPVRVSTSGKTSGKTVDVDGNEVEDRQRWYTDEEGEASTNDLYGFDPENFAVGDLIGIDRNSYAFSVAKYMGFGIVLAVLNMFVWTIFILGRCCCCCLWKKCCCSKCSPKPVERGYRVCCQIRIPVFFFLIMLAGRQLPNDAISQP